MLPLDETVATPLEDDGAVREHGFAGETEGEDVEASAAVDQHPGLAINAVCESHERPLAGQIVDDRHRPPLGGRWGSQGGGRGRERPRDGFM